MNFHSDEWIMGELNKHCEEALTLFPKSKIVGIFYQGSGNYGLDYCNSDVDSKCVLIPSLEDICLNREPVSFTHVRENGEHIDFKDIRKFIGDFKKQNINFLEILFTKYFQINDDYSGLWSVLITYGEEIAAYDNHRFVKSIAGMSLEKKKALTLDRPSQHDEIVKYGWATKQLHHLIRLNYFIKRWVDGESFANCLQTPETDKLTCVKQYGHVIYTLEQAIALAEELDNETNQIKEDYIKNNPHVINDDTADMLDEIASRIIRKSLKKELIEEDHMKKVICSKCGASSTEDYEVYLMEIGEIDNRCPVCGEIGSLSLEVGKTEENN